jgi:hypothetical protein
MSQSKIDSNFFRGRDESNYFGAKAKTEDGSGWKREIHLVTVHAEFELFGQKSKTSCSSRG